MDELNGVASLNESSFMDDTFLYLTEYKYPSQSSELQKRVIRNKTRRFFVHDGAMYFKKTAKGKVSTCVCMLIQYILLLYIMHRLLRCDVSGLAQNNFKFLQPAILTTHGRKEND